MTNAQTSTLVLKNEAGDYFLVLQEALERGRVADEHKTEIERLMASAPSDDGGDDVQGHWWLVPAIVTVGELSKGPGLMEILENARQR